jgi:hypothetical protein
MAGRQTDRHDKEEEEEEEEDDKTYIHEKWAGPWWSLGTAAESEYLSYSLHIPK